MAAGQARTTVQLTHDLDKLVVVSANNTEAIAGLTAQMGAMDQRVTRLEKTQKGLFIGMVTGNPLLGLMCGGLD